MDPPGAPDSFAPVAEVIELSAGKRQTLSSRAKRERDAAPALARARAAPLFRSAGFHQPRQLTLLPGVEEIGVTRVEPSRRER